jgi:Helix-turn-helix domain
VLLGQRLRWLRIRCGLSRRTVAVRLGFSGGCVEGHERGTGTIEAGDLVAYIRLYRVRVADLFRDLPTASEPPEIVEM